jgi:hypothetical protein
MSDTDEIKFNWGIHILKAKRFDVPIIVISARDLGDDRAHAASGSSTSEQQKSEGFRHSGA